MPAPKPSTLELQILSVLWQQGPLSAREVMERMPDQKPRAYTSVLSVMQVMEKKGFLNHHADGNRHIYTPLLKEQKVVGTLLGTLLKNVFAGKPSAVMQNLLSHHEISPEELGEMQRLLNEHKKRKG